MLRANISTKKTAVGMLLLVLPVLQAEAGMLFEMIEQQE